jgi:hypothetical protein
LFILILAVGLRPALALAAPEWIGDRGNSKWIVFGGEKGDAVEHGLHAQLGGGEGEPVRAERGGVVCARSVRPNGQLGYFYLKADAWTEFRAWQGDRDLLLTVHYWDGAPGQLAVLYDSSDARVRHDPYPAGVWRRPDAYPEAVKLQGSQTWKTLQVRLEFAMFSKRVHGADFRLDPSSADFALAGVAVTRVPKQAAVPAAGPNTVRYLENARLKIGIDLYGLHSIYDKRARRAIAAAPEMHDALTLIVTKPVGDAPTTTQDLYRGALEQYSTGGTAEAPTARMVHRLASGIRLTTDLKLRADGQMEWQLQIDNPTPLEVCEVRFPVVTGAALGGEPADDWIFVPRCWGQVWQNPGAQGLTTFWGPSMRWIDLWDGQSGLYLGIEDPKFEDYAFVYGGDRTGGVTIAAHQRILAPSAGRNGRSQCELPLRPESTHDCSKPPVSNVGTWKSGVYRLAATGGDWHAGGDIYRAYVARALRPCDQAPHIKWLLDGWQGQDSNLAPLMGWEMINHGIGGLNLLDPYFMAANRQMTDGMDSGYCGLYPYPAPGWGTTREFAQKLALRRALGGMYAPYHNFHLWSPGYGHYRRIGSFPKAKLPPDAPQPDDAWYAKAAAYSYNGSYARTETDYFGQYDMAMPSQEWRAWLYDWTRRYLAWGTDGMYYDQFNMIYGNGRLYPEFHTYGSWAPAELEVFSRMKRDGRATNPYFTSSGEVCNDVYGQYLDLHMTSGVWNRLDIWSYCNPHQILIDGAWNGGLADDTGHATGLGAKGDQPERSADERDRDAAAAAGVGVAGAVQVRAGGAGPDGGIPGALRGAGHRGAGAGGRVVRRDRRSADLQYLQLHRGERPGAGGLRRQPGELPRVAAQPDGAAGDGDGGGVCAGAAAGGVREDVLGGRRQRGEGPGDRGGADRAQGNLGDAGAGDHRRQDRGRGAGRDAGDPQRRLRERRRGGHEAGLVDVPQAAGRMGVRTYPPVGGSARRPAEPAARPAPGRGPVHPRLSGERLLDAEHQVPHLGLDQGRVRPGCVREHRRESAGRRPDGAGVEAVHRRAHHRRGSEHRWLGGVLTDEREQGEGLV